MSTSTSTQAEQVTCTGNNHFNCSRGCSPAPLTLWDREIITGRGDIRCRDDETGTWFCGDCLADLPADPYDQCSHICGQEPEPVAPEPESARPEVSLPAEPPAPRRARKGDVVYYNGSLTEYRGVYEVTSARGGKLRLVDIERWLANVAPEDVIVGGHVKNRARRTER